MRCNRILTLYWRVKWPQLTPSMAWVTWHMLLDTFNCPCTQAAVPMQYWFYRDNNFPITQIFQIIFYSKCLICLSVICHLFRSKVMWGAHCKVWFICPDKKRNAAGIKFIFFLDCCFTLYSRIYNTSQHHGGKKPDNAYPIPRPSASWQPDNCTAANTM